MLTEQHSKLVEFIWSIAERLRGPYRPPQYRKVMLPLIVLRRLDMMLEDSKAEVCAEYQRLKAIQKANEGNEKQKMSDDTIAKTLSHFVNQKHGVSFYNVSPYTFSTLLHDPNGLAANLNAYINAFSPNVRIIFDKFKFDAEIAVLDDKNRLFSIIKEFADERIDLHPDRVSNLQMGYIFEHLIRRFNEQANEEAGDHFTPREVITLMAHLVYTGDDDIYTPDIAKTIYDPACGTGGMLSVSEDYIRSHNPQAHLVLCGQDYNDESWAICCSDMLIKGENVENIALGDTLGDGKSKDQHEGEQFDYMLANPPFGVDWKDQLPVVQKEHETFGFKGRFGPGLPRINDGSLLFLLHMLSKRHPSEAEGGQPGDGSKIAIVFNGSPLFTGDAGGGESNIRRWIIENDWLDAVVALPDQLFYNTGIYTYIWLVSNRKPAERKGKVQLIDATRHFRKMKKSLGNKRNELSEEHIAEIARLYGEFAHNGTSMVNGTGEPKERVCSKVLPNQAFGYIKLTVERPLRVNVQVSPERMARFTDSGPFASLVESKKRKNKEAIEKDVQAGQAMQQSLRNLLSIFDAGKLYMDRAEFEADLKKACKKAGVKLEAPMKKALLSALSERDPNAAIVRDAKGNPEPDSDLRDTENVPLPETLPLPLPLGYGGKGDKVDNSKLVALVQAHCDSYFEREVKPHWPDAWIDYDKTKVGYEIPLTRHFYVYEPPRPLEAIEAEMAALEAEIAAQQSTMTGLAGSHA
ncbi:MAG: SAM-dependent DNA methyltransferase [Desulfovibrio sp.]|uniref:type I restriction-modification system subunit M n=1 Tax=Desulfovibrio sp. TaxID=885 RepID=UPI00135D970B|nr:class I SAM-dependent DNA methyltransferase [Desulfovibrio sp.]MTJ93769.1 SAM-dependent DNA methyltransferase [Desulfovibrio sp.]